MRSSAHIPFATLRRRCGVLVGVATACAFYALGSTGAEALDLDGTEGLITETIASRERLKDYDDIKLYGAERVSDRDRNYAKPDGIRSGNYFIFPEVGATVVYDDNIYRSNAHKEADWRSEITPAVKFQSHLPRHILDLSLDGKIVNYLNNTDQDYANVRAKLDGALHFDHAHTLSASVLTALEHEERGELLSDTSAAKPIEVFHNRASVGITRDVGRLYGTLMATFERWDYSDVASINGPVVDQDYRDTSEFSTALRFGYRFSPGFEFVGKIRALQDLNRGVGSDDRDAFGYEAMAGLAFETNPLLRWRLLAGYGIRNFEKDSIEDVSSALLEAQVQWLPTQYMTFTGSATRQILAADAVEPSGRVETRLLGRLDYEIWHNVVLNLGVEYRDAEFIGDPRRDKTITGRIGLDYWMNKNWRLSLGYEHAVRQSTEDEFDMTRNRFTVGAKLLF
ncbi:MAG: outer membrane beta-barrel protein [Hyphomicrobiaceae bacterium]|nr:outer membrane beta-barrel protein [Hyphomicrobiaceae bacterium]